MKLPPWEAVEVEVQVAEEEAEVEEEMEASLLPEVKMNPEWNEGQEEVEEAEVVAGRGTVMEGQRPTGGRDVAFPPFLSEEEQGKLPLGVLATWMILHQI